MDILKMLPTEKNEVFFNTPKDLNIELLFADMPNKFIPKVQCLLHLINKDSLTGGYQLNAENHIWFFGLKDAELSQMVERLIDNEIIERVSKHKSGEVSRVYKMVNPYTRDDSIKHIYPKDKYLFIQKWVVDGYVVKGSKYTAYIRPEKNVKNVSALALENKMLRDLLAANNISIPVTGLIISEAHTDTPEVPEEQISTLTKFKGTKKDKALTLLKMIKETNIKPVEALKPTDGTTAMDLRMDDTGSFFVDNYTRYKRALDTISTTDKIMMKNNLQQKLAGNIEGEEIYETDTLIFTFNLHPEINTVELKDVA
ncbi:hypothetical protein ACVW0P_003633 [Mucilaginibacter sp. UYNi724]